MKKILFILTLLFSLAASAQVDTTKQIQTISANGYAYKHLQAIYAMLHPTDTFRLKYDWRGIAFKDTLPYFWTGRAWRQFGTGSGGATDTSTFIVDTLYNPIAKVIGTDSIRLKSMRIRVNGTPVPPTDDDSTLDFNLTVETDPADLSGIRDTLGKKVDTLNVVQIDTTDRNNGEIVYWDSTARKYKHKTDSVGTGGSGSGAFSVLGPVRPGDENMPANGDSVLVHNSFSGKYLKVFRKGILQEHVVGDTGFARLSDTSIKVKPVFAADDWWLIEARDSSAYTQLTLQAPSTPPSTTIAYVNSADGGNNAGSGTTRTFSYTASSGSNTCLFVGFIGDVFAGADDVSSVTYNGVSMTLVGKTAISGGRWNYLYYLLNPASGAHNVVITCASSHWIMAGAAEYSGVQGVDTYTTNTVVGSSLTTTLTTGVDNCWTVLFSGNNGVSQSAGAGTTERVEAANNYWTIFDSNGPKTPAGSKSLIATQSAGAYVGHVMVSIKPY